MMTDRTINKAQLSDNFISPIHKWAYRR